MGRNSGRELDKVHGVVLDIAERAGMSGASGTSGRNQPTPCPLPPGGGLRFVKMHGCGNDYVYLDAVSEPAIERLIGAPGWVDLVRRMSDRHKGIGSDGVIVVCRPSTKRTGKKNTGGQAARATRGAGAHVRMRMFNADGSESEMCGNGVRCVAKFAHDRLGVRGGVVNVQTGNGVLPIEVRVRKGKVVEATVDMGEPREGLKANGVLEKKLAWQGEGVHWGVEDAEECLCGVFVSMGNPHFVVFEPIGDGEKMSMTPAEVGAVDLARIGPRFETHAAFAKRMNVHIAGVPSGKGLAKRIVMRTWERGSGITQACGTGACAVAVAGVLSGRSGREVDVDLPGGRLRIAWDKKSNHVFMTGEAVDVCEGEWLGNM